jgi:hypothetical protein
MPNQQTQIASASGVRLKATEYIGYSLGACEIAKEFECASET